MTDDDQPNLPGKLRSALARIAGNLYAKPPAPVEIDMSRPLWTEQLGRLRLLEKLARGGTGLLFLATTDKGLKVVVKFLAPVREHATDPVRFEEELRALLALDHPNVIAVLADGEQDERRFLVTEFADGGNLREYLAAKGGRLPAYQAARLTIQAARGVAAMHALGFVHRDIKPENLVITRAGVVKLIDCGIVRRPRAIREATVTAKGEVMGTPGYMPDEQWEPDGDNVGSHTDIAALVTVLAELVTGEPPIPTRGGGTKLPTVEGPLASVIEQGTAKDWSVRYTATELEIELGRMQGAGLLY